MTSPTASRHPIQKSIAVPNPEYLRDLELENERLTAVLTKLQAAAQNGTSPTASHRRSYKDITGVRHKNSELRKENAELQDEVQMLTLRNQHLESSATRREEALAKISSAVRKAVAEFNALKIKYEEELLLRQYAEDRNVLLEDQLKLLQQTTSMQKTFDRQPRSPQQQHPSRAQSDAGPSRPTFELTASQQPALSAPLSQDVRPADARPQREDAEEIKRHLRETQDEIRNFRDVALNRLHRSSSRKTSRSPNTPAQSATTKRPTIRSDIMYHVLPDEAAELNQQATAILNAGGHVTPDAGQLQQEILLTIPNLKHIPSPKESAAFLGRLRPSSQFIVGSVGELSALLAQEASAAVGATTKHSNPNIAQAPATAPAVPVSAASSSSQRLPGARARGLTPRLIKSPSIQAMQSRPPPPSTSLPVVPSSPDVPNSKTAAGYEPDFKDDNLDALRSLFDGLEQELRKPLKRAGN
ncbi:hypothetical protein RI367_001930 [Sorochytrium milnesiophthora]